MLISWQLDYFTLVRENSQAKISRDRTPPLFPWDVVGFHHMVTALSECGYFLFSKTGRFFFQIFGLEKGTLTLAT